MEGREDSHGEKGRRMGVGWKANGCGMEGRTEDKLKWKKKTPKNEKIMRMEMLYDIIFLKKGCRMS